MSKQLAFLIGVEAIFYGSVAFVVVTSLFWPWWQSRLGWTITAKSLALALAVLPAMIGYWFGAAAYHRLPWLDYVAIAGIWLVPPILAWRAWELWLVQRQATAASPGRAAVSGQTVTRALAAIMSAPELDYTGGPGAEERNRAVVARALVAAAAALERP